MCLRLSVFKIKFTYENIVQFDIEYVSMSKHAVVHLLSIEIETSQCCFAFAFDSVDRHVHVVEADEVKTRSEQDLNLEILN